MKGWILIIGIYLEFVLCDLDFTVATGNRQLVTFKIFDPMLKYPIRDYLKAGDIGKIVLFHGKYYSRRLGLNEEFEAYVAVPLAEFALRRSPDERIWIIESGEELIGTITLTRFSEETAQLRWFYVLPEFHGKGLGKLLIEKLLEFAVQLGYKKIILGTVSTLTEAISLYKKYGFKLIDSSTHFIWGQNTTEETYLKELKHS